MAKNNWLKAAKEQAEKAKPTATQEISNEETATSKKATPIKQTDQHETAEAVPVHRDKTKTTPTPKFPKEGTAAPKKVAPINRTDQHETAEAVPVDREIRPHRISSHLSDRHQMLLNKIHHHDTMQSNKRPRLCEIMEGLIEDGAEKRGIK